jgi:hypothetical protein
MGLNDEEDLGWGRKGYICGMKIEGIILGNKLNIYKAGRELSNFCLHIYQYRKLQI